jgi:hypothetical protein
LLRKVRWTVLQRYMSICRPMKYWWMNSWNWLVKGHLQGLTEQLWVYLSGKGNSNNWMHHLFHVDSSPGKKRQEAFWTFLLIITNKLLKVSLILSGKNCMETWPKLHWKYWFLSSQLTCANPLHFTIPFNWRHPAQIQRAQKAHIFLTLPVPSFTYRLVKGTCIYSCALHPGSE